MREIDFANGFEISEPLLWGLTSGQLGMVVAGGALGYLMFRSPLPPPAGAAAGVALVASALAVARVPFGGRTLLSWVGAALRFHSRPRSGLIVVEGRADGGAESAVEPERSPVTLLPKPVPACQDPGSRGESVARSRRLVFFSLAGGSGRTTLAVEIAGLLSARSSPGTARPVALADLDLVSPRASLRLGVPLAIGWEDFVDAGAVQQLVAIHPNGLRVVPGPAATGGGRLAGDPRLLARLEALLRKLEISGGTLALDIPAGLGAVSRWALNLGDDIVVVLTPTAGGIQDAYRSTEALRRLGHARKLRYVVNRGDDASIFDEAMADVGGTVLGCIPEDTTLTRAEAEHRLVALDGDGPTASSLRALAARLASPGQPEAVPVLRTTSLLRQDRLQVRQAG